jgi:hypothetical protein
MTRWTLCVVVAVVAACSSRTPVTSDVGRMANGVGVADVGGSSDLDGPGDSPVPCTNDCQCYRSTGSAGFCEDGFCTTTTTRSGPPQGICGDWTIDPSVSCLCVGGTCRDHCCYLPDGGLADPQGPVCQVECKADCQCPFGIVCLEGRCRPDIHDQNPKGICGGPPPDGGPSSAAPYYYCACNGGTCTDGCCYLPDGSIAGFDQPACQQ